MKDNMSSGEKLLIQQYLMLMRLLLEMAEKYMDGNIDEIDMMLVNEILKEQDAFKKFLV
jgi:hypothetical protein